jgi:hypothetical protein
MKKVLLALVVATGLLNTSCSSDLVSNTTTINPVDVYVAGQKDNQACYWKNNQPVLLASEEVFGTVATKIVVTNSDVHVLGTGVGTSPLGTIPMYWKNGALTNLKTTLSTPDEDVISITDMEIVGTDVYFVGYTKKTLIAFEDYSLAYWKNGIKTLVHNYGGYAQNEARIKVANNTVYLTGTNNGNFNSSGQIDGYYTNGVFTNISDSILNGLAVNNNEVYTFGTLDGVPYYKNISTNSETTLVLGSNGLTKLLFDNGNMYYTESGSIYKNGVLFDDETANSGGIKDFEILNDNIYKIRQEGVFSFISFLTINGVETMQLPNSDGSFQSIYVVQN